MAWVISIEWADYEHLQIRDIHEKQRERVREYVRQHFLSHELFKVLGYHDDPEIEQDLQSFLNNLLENDCSIVALDKETEEIQAVALLKWMSQDWRSWTELSLVINSRRFGELIDMIRSTLEDYAADRKEKWDSLHLFYFHVEAGWQSDQCFMSRFFKAICEVARHMHMPRVTYMALSQSDQEIMEEKAEGFHEIIRLIYSLYVYKGQRPFDHLRDINEMNASLYEKKVEALKPFEQMVVRHEGGEGKEQEKTRGDGAT